MEGSPLPDPMNLAPRLASTKAETSWHAISELQPPDTSHAIPSSPGPLPGKCSQAGLMEDIKQALEAEVSYPIGGHPRPTGPDPNWKQ